MRNEKNIVNDENDSRLITLIEGKLFLINDDKFILLTSPVLLRNGAVISMEGMMKLPDGRTRVLAEGECV